MHCTNGTFRFIFWDQLPSDSCDRGTIHPFHIDALFSNSRPRMARVIDRLAMTCTRDREGRSLLSNAAPTQVQPLRVRCCCSDALDPIPLVHARAAAAVAQSAGRTAVTSILYGIQDCARRSQVVLLSVESFSPETSSSSSSSSNTKLCNPLPLSRPLRPEPIHSAYFYRQTALESHN